MSRPKATAADLDRYQRLRFLGCLACRINDNGRWCGRPEVHHLVTTGYRDGNSDTICLGVWHHQGNPPLGHTAATARAAFGPSMYRESKAFAALYGSQQALLIFTDELLANQVEA